MHCFIGRLICLLFLVVIICPVILFLVKHLLLYVLAFPLFQKRGKNKLEALRPKAVVAGHKVPENDDDPRIIAETRQYLRDFNRLNEATVTARQLYDAMLELYPDRVNPGSLWGAANTAKKQA